MATPKKVKPKIQAVVYRRLTPVRKREKWGVRVVAANHLTLFASEKYVNHEDARRAADLLRDGSITVVDETL